MYENVLSDENILRTIFQFKRIVDPINRKTLEIVNDNIQYNEHECYSLWESGTQCENCISMRAYNEGRTFSKIECVGNLIYLIVATPINQNDNRYIVEVVRDITDDGITNFLISTPNESISNHIKRLNELVVRDELTGSFNRRYINEQIPYEINQATNSNYNLYVAMMDIDDFKLINDNYGHMCGDDVLKKVTDIINRSIEDNGWFARYGGDEFLIVLKCNNEDICYEIIEKIRKNIENYNFEYKSYNIKITCSFGISSADKYINNFESIIEDADKNLLKSKKLNKNIVIKSR